MEQKRLSKEEQKELENLVYNYKTTHKQGFLFSEEMEILKQFPDINIDKYNDAMRGNTCQMDEKGGFIIYHCDVFHALLCGLENRDLTLEEWD